MNDYEFLDSGNGKKLERFGKYNFVRPSAQALWAPKKSWDKINATFTREGGWNAKFPSSWQVTLENITFKVSPTEFGHLGLFPEHHIHWKWVRENVSKEMNILNLFAYSGGMTLAAAQTGAKVCHLDSAKGMVAWGRENAALNGLDKAPIRWIVDDAIKFLKRELKRGTKYDGIILDPPSFGRGSQGQVFKIERDLKELLLLCKGVLSKNAKFLLLTSHTPGLTPMIQKNLLKELFNGHVESGETLLEGENTYPLPCGTYARWYV